MAYSKIQFQPGINREGTAYDNEGGWFDGNLIRFRNGHVEKFGGWAKLSSNTFLGTGRALHNWMSLGSNLYLGLGTTWKYYIKEGNDYNDVTPIRATNTGTATFTSASGSSTVSVTDSSHGAVVNDFVTFSSAATLGSSNITATVLNQEYQIVGVTSTSVYTIVAKDTDGDEVTADATVSGGGGGSTVANYQINVGLDVYVKSAGYGSGLWGSGTFGSTSAISDTGQLRLWTHDNFGENLIINPRGGGIYRWKQDDGISTEAKALSGITGANLVPTLGLQVITSEVDRHLIVLGADPISGSSRSGTVDPMLIAFSDQENELEFEPLITNTSGSLRLSSGSNIVGAVKSRQEIVVFTDTSVYSMQFVGPPFTFAINLINEATGLIGPKAAVTGDAGIYFMSYGSFYLYNGTVQKLPCSVLNYVFSNINNGQAYKINAFTNSENSEVGWFYPSSSATEIDRYVIYNTQEQVWYYGNLERHAWLDSGVENFPQATNNNYVYQHEIGYNDDGSAMTNVYVESSDFDIGDGNQFSSISSIIPDIRFLQDDNSGSVNIVTKMRNYPGDSLTTKATSEISSSTTKANVRARGRQAVVRFESNDDQSGSGNVSLGWRVGATRFDVKTDGRR